MNKIFWSEALISVVMDQIETKAHKHLMLQLFIGRCGPVTITVEGNSVVGNYIIVDSDTSHEIEDGTHLDCFVLLDVTSTIAQQLKAQYIGDEGYAILPFRSECHKAFNCFYDRLDEESYRHFIASLFEGLDVSRTYFEAYDPRVELLIEKLNDPQSLFLTVEEVTEGLCLSASRVSHLFKEQTGIPLKSYRVLLKLKRAYYLLGEGMSITEAALEAGFCSPSHLADVNQRMMGRKITQALKDSGFMEVE